MDNSVESWTGLSSAQAAERLAADGPNELPRAGQRSFLGIVRDVLKEPMLLLLLGAGGFILLQKRRTLRKAMAVQKAQHAEVAPAPKLDLNLPEQ